MKATVNHLKKKPKCLILGVQCGVGSSPQRSGSLHSLALIGSHSANSILENSCLKTQPFSRCCPAVSRDKNRQKKTTKKQNTARVLTHTSSAGGSLFLPPQQPASVSVRFGVLRFCPTARKT